MAKRLVVLALFLAIPLALLLLDFSRPAPGGPAQPDRSSRWLLPPANEMGMAANLEQGRYIFRRDCAHCHGERGDGVSSNMDTLHPAPFDLTSFELSESFIQRVVREGLPGSDMPGWSLGSYEDIRDVAAYTASLGRPDTLAAEDRYAPPEMLHEGGRRVFAMHCVSCHGEQGNGDGPDAAKHLPRPASFADMRPSYAAARHVIENGVHGTAMASWPLLTSPEIQAVTFYLRTLYTSSRAVGERP